MADDTMSETADTTAEEAEAAPHDQVSERPTAASGDGTVEHGELIGPDGEQVAPDPTEPPEHPEHVEAITEPAKVMRIGSMVKQLLEEVRQAPLDEASRERLAEIYERSVVELSEALSPDLQDELRMLAIPFDEDTIPSEAELRIAKAQLVGWLEGLFHGIQASLMAQQMAARQQLEQMRQIGPGQRPGQPGEPGHGLTPPSERPGTYL